MDDTGLAFDEHGLTWIARLLEMRYHPADITYGGAQVCLRQCCFPPPPHTHTHTHAHMHTSKYISQQCGDAHSLYMSAC